jgi:adenosine deaminase CECR1
MNPYSNCVLNYISDLRLHPALTFFNYGIPICINPDDPGLFGYKGVSLD